MKNKKSGFVGLADMAAKGRTAPSKNIKKKKTEPIKKEKELNPITGNRD